MIDFGHGVLLNSFMGDYDCNHMGKTYYWRNDYRIWKWCRQNDCLEWSNHVKYSDKISDDKSIKMYSIYVTDIMIGVCGLTDIDNLCQRAEFSLYIAPDYQRKGYASAALKTLFSHGFMNQNLNVIWGETFEGNPAYDLFLKIGMKHEGTRRQFYYKEGKHIDAHLVSMTRSEFMEAPWKQVQL